MIVGTWLEGINAIGNEKFCSCFATNAPAEVNFTKYVEFFEFKSNEFDYDKLSPNAKKLYNSIRKVRDLCVGLKDKEHP